MSRKMNSSAASVLKRIDRRLAALGLSDNAASEQAGSRDTIRSIRKNVAKGTQRGVSTETLARLAPVLRTSIEWLTTGTGPETDDAEHIESGHVLADDQPQRAVPVVGYVGAGAQEHRYAVSAGELERAPWAPDSGPNTVAAEIRGDSLGKHLNGWLVYYDEARSPVTPDLIGQLCVVCLPDDRMFVKIVQRGAHGKFDLLSPNDETVAGVDIQWAAKVTNLRRK